MNRQAHPVHRDSFLKFHNAAQSPLGRIYQAGELHSRRASIMRPMRVLGGYAVVYVYDGDGHYEDVTGRRQAITAGDLILVLPDLAHDYGPGPEGWREVYLVFDGPVFDLWRRAGLLSEERPVLHLEPVHHWHRRFTSVLGVAMQPGWSPAMLDVCRLQQVLAEALTDAPNAGDGQADASWAARACALLGARRGVDRAGELSLAEVARQMHCSYATFHRRFSRVVGMTPGRYRMVSKIDRACELMQQSDRADKQIAAMLGFCDEFHFSRRFKQITGQTPRAFHATLPGGSDGVTK